MHRSAVAFAAFVGVSVVFLAATSACSGSQTSEQSVESPQPLSSPVIDGLGSLGPLSVGPSAAPFQAGTQISGSPIPTNQWWTSALTGPGTQNLWAVPLAVRVRPAAGVDVTLPPVEVSSDAIVAASSPSITVIAEIADTHVVSFGDYSLEMSAETANGRSVGLRLAQGYPAATLELDAGPVELATTNPEPIALTASGAASVTIEVNGREWTIAADRPVDWRAAGTSVLADLGERTRIALIPTPDDAVENWQEFVSSSGAALPGGTSSEIEVDWATRTVSQTLSWSSASDTPIPLVGLLPHQWAALSPKPEVLGSYETPRGPVRLVPASEVHLDFEIAPFLPGVPDLSLGPAALSEVAEAAALDPVEPIQGGSYFGMKALGRLATIVEVSRAIGNPNVDAETTLRAGVGDWLTYDGPTDQRWLAWDPSWGGIIAQPPEFGSESYNDHHFHYGYLLHAAAVVGEFDQQFVDDFRPIVDLVVSDLLGTPDHPSLAALGVMNPYLGHSGASGFAPFADGNNQESSSEAVNAWWAVTRWGLATADEPTIDAGAWRFGLEAEAARTYWLNELGPDRPAGYVHEVAGIVWDGKIDFATFFDARPSAAIGIQLLPVNFSSLYRSDPGAAERRFSASGTEPIWPDIAAMDLAVADPRAARLALPEDAVEAGNSFAFAHFWVEALARLGAPRSDIACSSPIAAAFGDSPTTVVAINSTSETVEVECFEGDDRVVAFEAAGDSTTTTEVRR